MIPVIERSSTAAAAHQADRTHYGLPTGNTLKSAMLGAAGGNEVERHMGSPTDVLVRKRPGGALVASTHHSLAKEIRSPNHKDKQNDGNDWADSVGPSVRDATGGGGHILTSELIGAIRAVGVTVTLLFFSDAQVVTAAELVRRADCFTVVLIGLVSTVRFTIAVPLSFNATSFMTLELNG